MSNRKRARRSGRVARQQQRDAQASKETWWFLPAVDAVAPSMRQIEEEGVQLTGLTMHIDPSSRQP